MSTAKEKVLTYLKEQSGKEVNPANDCSVFFMGYYWISMFGEHVLEIRGESSSEAKFAQAARILKLDKPRAAAIQWREASRFLWASDSGYQIDLYPGDGKYHPVFQSGDICSGLDTLEAAKQACQDHKQSKLEELL